MELTRRSATLGLAGLPLLSAGARADTDARTLRVSMEGDPDSLDPHKSTLIYARIIHQQLWLPLITYGPDGAFIPGSAQSWDVSADGLLYRFRLFEGLQWSDGRALNAQDFVYSFRRMLDPKTAYPSAEVYFGIQNAAEITAGTMAPDTLGVRATGEHDLEIRLTTPNPFFLALVSIAYAVPRHAVEAHGPSWTQAGRMVTNGAFALRDRTPNSRIDLVRNPRSAAAAPGLDAIAYFPMGDQATSTRRFLAGEIDVHYSATPIEFDKLKKQRPESAVAFDALRTDFLTFNTRRPALADVRVRKALALLADREVIARRIVGGAAEPAFQLVRPGWPGIADRPLPDYAAWQRSKAEAEARALLSEAGYSRAKPLRLEFIYSGQIRQRIAVALQSMWAAAGAEISLLSKEVGGLFAQLDGGDFDIGISGFDMGVIKDPHDVLAGFEPGGWAERSGHRNSAFEGYMKKSRTLAALGERGMELAAAEQAWLADFPIAPLYFERALWFIAPHVKGWMGTAQPFFFRHLSIEGRS